MIGCFRCPWRLSRKVAVRLVEVIGVRGGRFRGSLREMEQPLSTREGRGHNPLGILLQLGAATAIPSNGSSTTRREPSSARQVTARARAGPSDRHRTRRRTDRAARPAIGRASGTAPFPACGAISEARLRRSRSGRSSPVLLDSSGVAWRMRWAARVCRCAVWCATLCALDASSSLVVSCVKGT